MSLTLDVWDFDGTLLRTPTKVEGVRIRGEITFHGWWARTESLADDMVPDPLAAVNGKAAQEFLRSKMDNHTISVILTGRKEHLRPRVLDLLDKAKLLSPSEITDEPRTDAVACYFKPHFSMNSVFDYKASRIRELVSRLDISIIRVFEDRKPQALLFKELFSKKTESRWSVFGQRDPIAGCDGRVYLVDSKTGEYDYCT